MFPTSPLVAETSANLTISATTSVNVTISGTVDTNSHPALHTETVSLLPVLPGDNQLAHPLHLHAGLTTSTPSPTGTTPTPGVDSQSTLTSLSHTTSEPSPNTPGSWSTHRTTHFHHPHHSQVTECSPTLSASDSAATTCTDLWTPSKGKLVAATLPGFLVSIAFLVCLAWCLRRRRKKALQSKFIHIAGPGQHKPVVKGVNANLDFRSQGKTGCTRAWVVDC